MWGDKDVKIKLLKKGILTRINAPKVRILFDVCTDKLERVNLFIETVHFEHEISMIFAICLLESLPHSQL